MSKDFRATTTVDVAQVICFYATGHLFVCAD
jgi:hypothetical protein